MKEKWKTVENKNIIIAASGTGGHIYPGMVLAKEFKYQGYNPIFFINNNAASIEILKFDEFKYITFATSGIPRKISFSFIPFLCKMIISFLKALKQITTLKPVAVIGTGGYVTAPIIFAAKILGKKTFIHEQNTVPGKANILLNKVIDKTFISFNSSEKYFKNKNVIVSGYPVREDILTATKEKSIKLLGLEDNVFTILVFGGSLGAVKLNEITCESLVDLSFKNKIQVLHITGSKSYDKIQKQIENNQNYKIFKYLHNITDAYVASDVIICRSGAGTVFELKALGKSAIVVPYPYATDNHQYWNAKEIEEDKKIIIIEEKYLTKEKLTEALYVLKDNIKKNTSIKNIVKTPQKLMFEEIKKCIES